MLQNQDPTCKYFFDNDYWVVMLDTSTINTQTWKSSTYVLAHFVKEYYTLFYKRNWESEKQFEKLRSSSLNELLLKMIIMYPNLSIYKFKHQILANGTYMMDHNFILNQLILLHGEHDDKAKIL